MRADGWFARTYRQSESEWQYPKINDILKFPREIRGRIETINIIVTSIVIRQSTVGTDKFISPFRFEMAKVGLGVMPIPVIAQFSLYVAYRHRHRQRRAGDGKLPIPRAQRKPFPRLGNYFELYVSI